MLRRRRGLRLSLSGALLTAIIAVFAGPAKATELFEPNTSVRALGMGNAYSAIVRDADSLFYNPAGIAAVSGMNWTIGDLRLGANGSEVMEIVADVQDAATFSDTIRSLYGDHVWLGVGGKTAFAMPYFAAALYNHIDFTLDVNNPAYPTFDLSYINDVGYLVGTGLPIGPFLDFGLGLKYIRRTGARYPFGAADVATLDPDVIVDQLQNKGRGYGIDLGATLHIPGPLSPSVSFVWKNVGMTKFKHSDVTIDGPPREVDEMVIGAAATFDVGLVAVTPVFDFKHLNRTDVQLARKFHFGVEISLPVIDIRAGFNEGYYTYGAGVNLGIMRFDAASYGVELGEYPGQREDRRYVVQFTMEIGFDPSMGFLGGGSGGSGSIKSSSSSGGGGGSSSGGRSGGGGGRRLKQRR